MNAAMWERVSAIAEELLECEPESVDGEIERLCHGDGALAAAVRDLVSTAAAVRDRSFLEKPAGAGLANEAGALATGLCGATIDGFDLVRILAEGGMGIVFEARQRKPERRVAVKVLRPGHASRSAVRRFEVESEVLAGMQHPAIARVIAAGVHRFDGGGLAFDLPWYAMELLEGARDLLTYARDAGLGLDGRLDLFVRACRAVQYSHQRGVIHRDLKPGNILVDGNGDPKVIDFGVARMSDRGAASRVDQTAVTRGHDLLGTLRYMAPEQVDGRADRVDVRTDVYALGVVLFELVTGTSPLALDESTLDEAVRAIRSAPPKIPSHVRPSLTREVDWIMDRCLAKDPDERYGSVAGLIADLEHLRRGEALTVGPRDVRYRVRVLLRRNRAAVAAASGVIALLAGWVASLSAALERAHDAESEASLRADEAGREAEKLRAVRDYFGVAVDRARQRADGEALGFRQVIDELERALETHEMPLEVAAVLATDVAGFRVDVEQPQRAIDLLEPMIDRLASAGLAATHEAGRVHAVLARARQRVGDASAAREHAEAARSMLQAPSDPSDVDLSRVLLEWQRVRQLIAEEKLDEAELALRALLAPFECGANDPMNNAPAIGGALAVVLTAQGRYGEAEPFARGALEADRAHYGVDAPRTANSAAVLAAVLVAQGDATGATRLLEDAWPVLSGLPDSHRFVLSARETMALAKRRLGARDEALEILEDVLGKRRGADARWDREGLRTVSRMGDVLVELRRYEDAERCLAEALDRSEAALGVEHPLRIAVSGELGRVLVLLGQEQSGIARLDDALLRLARVEGESVRVARLRAWLEQARAGTLTPEG